MARRRRPTSLGEPTDGPHLESRQRRGRRRRFPWLLVVLLTLGVAVFFAPQIITQTALKESLIQWALPAGAAHVEVGTAQASWLTPVTFRSLKISDVQGQPLIAIEELSTERRLFDLIRNYRDLGTIHVRDPHLNLMVTMEGSNLQEALATFSNPGEPTNQSPTSTSSPVRLGLEITNGRIDVTDQVSGTMSTAANINLSLHVPKANESELTLTLAADTIQGQQTGALQADVKWQPPGLISAKDLGTGQITLKSTRFPLPILSLLLSRTVPDLRLDGQLNTDLTCNWANQTDRPAMSASGALEIDNALFGMASVIGNDEIRSRRITAELEANIDQNRVQIESLRTDSEFGQLSITGSAPLSELVAADVVTRAMSPASQHQLQAEGRLDLAQLAQAIPETLRLREGTSITEGALELKVTSQNAGDGRKWTADVTTTTLAGMANGQPVRWDQPIQVNFVGRPVGQTWVVDRLQASSQFLRVAASGSPTDGQFQASGNLGSMLTEVQKFADLSGLQLVGDFESKGEWQTDAAGHVTGKTIANIRQFGMAYAGMNPWQENALELSATFQGQVQEQTIRQIDQASASLVSGVDQLQAVLAQPVIDPRLDSDWPIRTILRGQVETWLARLQPFFSIGNWNIGGTVEASATGVCSTTAVSLQPIDVMLTDVRATSGGQVVVDPQVKINGAVQWDQKSQRATIPSATIACSTLAVRAQDIDISLVPDAFSATGTTSFRADLQRIWTWMSDPAQPTTMVPQGLAVGNVQLSTTNNRIRFVGDAKVTDLVMNSLSTGIPGSQPAWNRTWHESELTMNASGTLDQPADLLQLDKLTIVSDAVQLSAQGNIDKLGSAPYANVQGQLQYDWQRVLDKVRQQVGPQVQVVGQHNLPFTVRGPLTSVAAAVVQNPTFPGQQPRPVRPVVPPELTAELTLGWDRANLYGMVIGPQQIKAKLIQGTIVADPISLAITNNTATGDPSAARLTMAPRVELNSQPMMLSLDQTTAVENIELTPELCSHWLKYVTPLMAGTATASGRLSAHLTGARIPLANPVAADLAGQVTIHQARVSPGPMAQQLLSVSQQVGNLLRKDASKMSFLQADKTWLEIEQQQIEFQMGGGRVYHRNLEFELGDAVIQSHGWVGLDQTIALETNIPIQDKWIEKEKLLAGMRGQSIQIPIRGTFSHPQLDQRALANISQQVIGSTAEQFIQGELQRGLQKLLGPK